MLSNDLVHSCSRVPETAMDRTKESCSKEDDDVAIKCLSPQGALIKVLSGSGDIGVDEEESRRLAANSSLDQREVDDYVVLSRKEPDGQKSLISHENKIWV